MKNKTGGPAFPSSISQGPAKELASKVYDVSQAMIEERNRIMGVR